LVTGADAGALAAPLARLGSDIDHARRLAAGAVAAGQRDFDPAAVRSQFLAALAGG
jgi:hypothetical protein